MLHVVYKLYSTSFSEASEFSKAWKGGKSLIEFATETFGPDDARTKMLIEAVPWVEEAIAMRDAVEHPDGYSGRLVIENFRRDPDQSSVSQSVPAEGWQQRNRAVSIRADFDTFIHNLLTLGEDVLVSWANENSNGPR